VALLRPFDPGTAADPLGAEAAAAAWTPLRTGVASAVWRFRWALAVGAWAVAGGALYFTPLAGHLNPYLTITGVLVGLLIGLTGMGGGALMTPILILFFGFQPTLAIGTDISYAAVTKVFGSWRHFRQRSVDLRLALWLALGSVPSGVLGAMAVDMLKKNHADVVDAVLYRAIGSALMAVGVLLVVRLILKVDKQHPEDDLHLSSQRKIATVLVGAVAGFVIGLTSVGSGTLLAMVLILFYPLATRRIVGTDVFHATILLGATALAQLRFGNVNLWMVGALLIGSVPGVIVGSHLTMRTPAKWLRVALAVMLFASGIAMLGRA
jgi:uncharacterized protein